MGFFKERMIPKGGVTTKPETEFLCKDFSETRPCPRFGQQLVIETHIIMLNS